MRFTVDTATNPRIVRAVEDGPQFACWQHHEECAFYAGGPCTEIPCTCESTGVCMSCPPRRSLLFSSRSMRGQG